MTQPPRPSRTRPATSPHTRETEDQRLLRWTEADRAKQAVDYVQSTLLPGN